MSFFGAVGAGAEGAGTGAAAGPVGAAAGGALSVVSSIFAPDKNPLRRQRELALYNRVLAGGADGQAAAQTLYENATGANGDNNPAATRTYAQNELTQLAAQGITIGNHTITGGKYGQGGMASGQGTNGTNAPPTSILSNIFGQNQQGTGAGQPAAGQAGLGPIGGYALVGLLAAGLIYAIVTRHKGK